MKKVLFMGLAVLALSATSCKKTRTCECDVVQTMDGEVISTSHTTVETEEKCDKVNSETEMMGMKQTMTCKEK